MTNLYYNAIYQNSNKADAMMRVVNQNFLRFERYLRLAKKAQERKRISAKWKKVKNKEIQLTPLVQCVKVYVSSEIEFEWKNYWYEVKDNLKGIDRTEPIIMKKARRFIDLKEEDILDLGNGVFRIRFDFLIDDDEDIVWNNRSIKLKEYKLSKSNLIIEQSGSRVKISDLEKVDNRYKIKVSSSLNINENLVVNGFIISNCHVKLIEDGIVTDENGEILKVLERDQNLYYFKNKFSNRSKLKINDIYVDFEIIDLPEPQFFIEQGERFTLQKEKDRYVISDDKNLIQGETTVVVDGKSFMEYKVSVLNLKENPNSILVELVEDDDYNGDNGNYSIISKLDYFFSEGVDQLENSPIEKGEKIQKFKIERKYEETRRLLLRREPFSRRPLRYEDLPEELYISVNTYQLEKQIRCLNILKKKPLSEHKPLLALTEMKEKENNPWEVFEEVQIHNWFVLQDEKMEGTKKQREFVQKALGTKDFLLLEGPPGSGKTTAIVELIIQLIRKGKSVLLSASTHVAIDNVLERLAEKEEFMKGILPLRIGDSNNVSESVKYFQIDNLLKNCNEEYKDIVVEAANLVCGTTIGILKHPLFKEDRSFYEPAVPLYDYLIIDESSKTTFQEFIVPGLYAKRWILVGDVHQLSPYTERDHLVASFEDMTDEKGYTFFDKDAQRAALLIFKYIYKRHNDLKYCIVDNERVITNIKEELKVKSKAQLCNINLLSKVAFLTEKTNDVEFSDVYFQQIAKIECQLGDIKSCVLLGVDILFISESDLKTVKDYIPADMLVINRSDWEEEAQFYQMTACFYKNASQINNCYKEIKENNKFLKDKSWAEEVVWRMIRMYELSNKNIKNIDNEIDKLTPIRNEDKIKEYFKVISEIALPSILESLQKGIGKKRSNEKSTVLNSGFDSHIFKPRFVCLEYQYRMHPDISEYPRSQFYQGEALIDSSRLDRSWKYNEYSSRSIWVNVNGETHRNINRQEVQKLMEELKTFISWAKKNPKKDQKDNLWTVACLTFYRGQERKIREELRKYTGLADRNSQFEKDGIKIVLYTIDKFQGREADITFLSMVQTKKDGFIDCPNRLNVALTRARYQRVIIGKRSYFSHSRSDDLKKLTEQTQVKGEQ